MMSSKPHASCRFSILFFFSSRRRHTISISDWSSDVCSSDVLALNTTDTLEVQFACGRIGAVFLPLNTRLTVPELHYIVGDAAPRLMIHDSDLAEVALSVAKLCKVDSALLLGPGGSYEAAIAAAKPLDKTETVTLDDISTIMYTSGTTGQPK